MFYVVAIFYYINIGGKLHMQLTIREPGSAITHFIAMIGAILASVPILIKSAFSGSTQVFLSICIFMGSMIILYGASTLYHSVNLAGDALLFFKKMDHMMIFVLIAGSYTPVCMTILEPVSGRRLLLLVWGIAVGGILLKALWVSCPKWFSSLLYISMGWVVIPAVRPLYHLLSRPAFLWLLAGGLMYTAGGIIYALKLPLFNAKHRYFGSHEIFHLFVIGGSVCHFIFMFRYVA